MNWFEDSFFSFHFIWDYIYSDIYALPHTESYIDDTDKSPNYKYQHRHVAKNQIRIKQKFSKIDSNVMGEIYETWIWYLSHSWQNLLCLFYSSYVSMCVSLFLFFCCCITCCLWVWWENNSAQILITFAVPILTE